MVPPSATEGVALSITVEVSRVSVTVVSAGVLLIASCSKLPPLASMMRALTSPPST